MFKRAVRGAEWCPHRVQRIADRIAKSVDKHGQGRVRNLVHPLAHSAVGSVSAGEQWLAKPQRQMARTERVRDIPQIQIKARPAMCVSWPNSYGWRSSTRSGSSALRSVASMASWSGGRSRMRNARWPARHSVSMKHSKPDARSMRIATFPERRRVRSTSQSRPGKLAFPGLSLCHGEAKLVTA